MEQRGQLKKPVVPPVAGYPSHGHQLEGVAVLDNSVLCNPCESMEAEVGVSEVQKPYSEVGVQLQVVVEMYLVVIQKQGHWMKNSCL